jgi:hypothetical protein
MPSSVPQALRKTAARRTLARRLVPIDQAWQAGFDR